MIHRFLPIFLLVLCMSIITSYFIHATPTHTTHSMIDQNAPPAYQTKKQDQFTFKTESTKKTTVLDQSAKDELLVIQVSPTGTLSRWNRRKKLTLRFSHPMVSQDQLQNTVKPTIEITPKHKGRWYWSNDTTLVFTPRSNWEKSQAYTVKIKGPFTSINAAHLDASFQQIFNFKTQSNYVKSVRFYQPNQQVFSNSDQVHLNMWTRVCFDQELIYPITHYVTLYKVKGRQLPLQAVRQEQYQKIKKSHVRERSGSCYWLFSPNPLVANTKYRLLFDKIDSKTGTLVNLKKTHQDFRTFPPLALQTVNINQDPLKGPLYITFNNDINWKALKESVRIIDPHSAYPKNLIDWDYTKKENFYYNYNRAVSQLNKSYWNIYGRFEANHQYVLEIDTQTLVDKFNQKLTQQPKITRTFKTYNTAPYFSRFQSRVNVEPISLPMSMLSHVNLEDICVQWYQLSAKSLAQYFYHHTWGREELIPVTAQHCFQLANPEIIQNTRIPLSPFRFPQWKSTLPTFEGDFTPKQSMLKKQKKLKDQARKVEQAAQAAREKQIQEDGIEEVKELPATPPYRCQKPTNRPTAIELSTWLQQRPLAYSTDKYHFYLLHSDWSWYDPNDVLEKPDKYTCTPWRNRSKDTLLQMSYLGLHVKVAQKYAYVFAWDLRTGDPIPKTQVKLINPEGKVVLRGHTNQQGLLRFNLDKLDPKKEPWVYLNRFGGRPTLLWLAETDTQQAFVVSNQEHAVYVDGYYSQGMDYASPAKYHAQRGTLWTERDLYRPGEPLYVSGLVATHTQAGLLPITQQDFILKVRDPRYQVIMEHPVKSDNFGYIHHNLTLAQNSMLGAYEITLEVKPSDSVSKNPKDFSNLIKEMRWYTSFNVKSFKVPRFLVSSEAKPHQNNDQLVSFYATGRYLYDAPMSDKKWRVEFYLKSQKFSPSWDRKEKFLQQFTYGVQSTYDYEKYHETLPKSQHKAVSEFGYFDSARGTLDATGQTLAQMDVHKQAGRVVEHKAFFTIQDDDEQRAQTQSRVIVHPADRYLGLKKVPQKTLADQSKMVGVDVVAIQHKTLKSVAQSTVKVSLFRRFWNTVYIKDEVGRQRAQSDWEWVHEGSCLVDIKAQASSRCSLKVQKGGYLFWVAEAKTKEGDPLLATQSQYIYAYEPHAWKVTDGNQLKITSTIEKDIWQVGDTLSLIVKSPYPKAYAWITVEQNEIIKQYAKEWKTGELLSIPIDQSMIPNARVTVTLFQGRLTQTNEEGDLGRPSYRYGVFNFKVAHQQHALKVQVKTDQSHKKPGDSLTVSITAKDHLNQPVQGGKVIVWAVDRGVVKLSGYTVPNILSSLYKPLVFYVLNATNLTYLLPHLSDGEKGRHPGGGGDEEGEMGESSNPNSTVRKNFKVTPFFVDQLQLDQDGQVTHTVQLPDNLTTFDIFAVVIQHQQKDTTSKNAINHTLRTGQAKGKVIVRKPLMVRRAMPSTLTQGDKFLAGVTLNSTMAQAMKVIVKGEVKGEVKALSPLYKEIDLKAVGTQMIRFPFQATATGKADFKWTISTQEEGQTDRIQDGIQYEITVRPLALPQVQAIHGSTQTKRIHKINLPKASQIKLNVNLSSSILSNFIGDTQTLLDYPHGCLEQRSSKILPYAIFKDLSTHYNKPLSKIRPSTQENLSEEDIIQQHLQVLSRMQTSHGGLRYWPNQYSAVHAWSSTYAWMVLMELSQNGYALPLIDHEALKNFIRKTLQQAQVASNQSLFWNSRQVKATMSPQTAALMTYALARYDQPDLKTEQRLLTISADLPLFAKALLVAALNLGTEDIQVRKQASKAVVQQLINALEVNGDEVSISQFNSDAYLYDFSSQDRSLAMILIALLHYDAQHTLIVPIVRTLLRIKNGLGTLKNTQASAFALMAIRDYVKIREKEVPNFTAVIKTYTPQKDQVTKFDVNLLHQQDFKERSLDKVTQEYTVDHTPYLQQLNGLSFEKTGVGSLYYNALFKYHPTEMSFHATHQGMSIRRAYRLYDSEKATGKIKQAIIAHKKGKQSDLFPLLYTHSYRAGDLVEVELEVYTPIKRHYVVIQDPLPAGLELVDTDLKTWAKGYERVRGGFDHIELGQGEVRLFADQLSKGHHHFTYLARAITVGTFSRVAAHVHEMYRPEISANTESGQFWIHP